MRASKTSRCSKGEQDAQASILRSHRDHSLQRLRQIHLHKLGHHFEATSATKFLPTSRRSLGFRALTTTLRFELCIVPCPHCHDWRRLSLSSSAWHCRSMLSVLTTADIGEFGLTLPYVPLSPSHQSASSVAFFRHRVAAVDLKKCASI